MPTTKKPDHRKARRSPPRSNAPYPRRDPRVFVAVRRSSAGGSPVARSLLIPHKVSSLRCGTLRRPRIHVVKMRGRSFAPRFNENYPLSRSFSLRVVGVTPPHPLARVLYPRAPCGGIIPPHPHTIALSLFHTSDLSRNSAEKFRGRVYYTPTPPSYCFIPLSCTRFVKEQRRKVLRAQPAKIFAPLTTTKSYNS